MISSLNIDSKRNEVRLLELEVQELELREQLAQLKAERPIDGEHIDLQEELDECHETIKKQNQILLHIKAELEAIQQCDPFNSVFIAGSIENIFNVIKEGTDLIFDDGCIGCAGLDVAARLQKELDECNERCTKLGSHNMQITANLLYRKSIIEELKDRNAEDLHELYAIDKAERNKLASTIEDQKRTIDRFINYIGGLEAELSACKEDSEVLRKVVEAVRLFNRSDRTSTQYAIIMDRIDALLKDYHDAPEGQPETPIDETQDITVTFAFLELP